MNTKVDHNSESEVRKDWFRGINSFDDVAKIMGSVEKAKEILTDETAKKLFPRYAGADKNHQKWEAYVASVKSL